MAGGRLAAQGGRSLGLLESGLFQSPKLCPPPRGGRKGSPFCGCRLDPLRRMQGISDPNPFIQPVLGTAQCRGLMCRLPGAGVEAVHPGTSPPPHVIPPSPGSLRWWE